MPNFTETAGLYTVDVVSLNDYSDGRIRVEPPLHGDAEYWNEWIGDEAGIFINYVVSGHEATLASFQEQHRSSSVEDRSPEERVRFAISVLTEDLAQIQSAYNFKNQYERKGI